MNTKDKYLLERNPEGTISIKDYKKAKKENQKKAAKNLDARIVKMMNNVIDVSALYRDGLVTREEYKDFLKDIMKVI